MDKGRGRPATKISSHSSWNIAVVTIDAICTPRLIGVYFRVLDDSCPPPFFFIFLSFHFFVRRWSKGDADTYLKTVRCLEKNNTRYESRDICNNRIFWYGSPKRRGVEKGWIRFERMWIGYERCVAGNIGNGLSEEGGREEIAKGGKEGERKERNRFTDFRQGGVSATNSKLDGKWKRKIRRFSEIWMEFWLALIVR